MEVEKINELSAQGVKVFVDLNPKNEKNGREPI